MKCERCDSPSTWRYGAVELCDSCLPIVRQTARRAATVGAKKARRNVTKKARRNARIRSARQRAEKRNARRAQRRAGKTGGEARRLSEKDV